VRVVMLTNAIAPDKLGGLERYVRELSAELVRGGAEVTVLAKRAGPEQPAQETGADGVRIVRHPVPDKRDPSFALRYPVAVAAAVGRALDGGDRDTVVHGHFPVPTLVPALRKRPYVYTLHAPVYRELLSERQGSYLLPRPAQYVAVRALRGAEQLVLRRAAHIITLSAFMRREVQQLDPGAGPRSTVVSGGIDTSEFTPGPTEPLTWPRSRPLLFTARRLVPRTGVLQLVQAMPDVLRALPGAHLAVAGDGAQRATIGAEIDRLGLGDRIHLLGQVVQPELVDWYRRAELVITPTQELEGFGLATAEALSCATPCLVTPAGANPELVRGLSPDLVAEGIDPVSIARAIIRVCSDVDALADLGRRARAAIEPAMGWPNIAEQHLEIYRALSSSAPVLARA
jgi:glycosyltransferase involved in cell wall biosynthesis